MALKCVTSKKHKYTQSVCGCIHSIYPMESLISINKIHARILRLTNIVCACVCVFASNIYLKKISFQRGKITSNLNVRQFCQRRKEKRRKTTHSQDK